jgi:hypothetical protein
MFKIEAHSEMNGISAGEGILVVEEGLLKSSPQHCPTLQ